MTPEDLRIWTWSAVARGAKGINYYAWYPMSTGYESGGFGLNNLDGSVTERARVAGSIARVIDRHQTLLLDARPPRAEVAIVYNPLAHFVGGRQRATPYGGPQGEVAGIERDSLLGVHRALFPENVPVDFVHINHLSAGRLDQYKLVILPYPPMLPEASAAAIRAYVNAGGALVTEARLGWNNERGYPSDRVPGLALWEVVGAHETAIETAPNGRTSIRWTTTELPGIKPGDEVPARWYKETLEPATPSARVVARFADGAAAAVMSTFGKGKTLMLGSYVSAAYHSNPAPATARFYRGLLAWAGVTPPVTTSGSVVEARALASGADTLLFRFNHDPRAVASSQVTVRGISAAFATDLVQGQPITVSASPAGAAIQVQIPPSEVRVLRITPR